MVQIFRGYVQTKDKKPIQKFKGIDNLPTLEEVEQYDEYAGILNDEYTVMDVDDAIEAEKTYHALNFVTGKSTDEELYIALDIIEYILLEAEGAPLKKAILDAKIGKDALMDPLRKANYPLYLSNILDPLDHFLYLLLLI